MPVWVSEPAGDGDGVGHSMPESVPALVPALVPKLVPEPVPESAPMLPEPVPEPVPESAPVWVPESVQVWVPESKPGGARPGPHQAPPGRAPQNINRWNKPIPRPAVLMHPVTKKCHYRAGSVE